MSSVKSFKCWSNSSVQLLLLNKKGLNTESLTDSSELRKLKGIFKNY